VGDCTQPIFQYVEKLAAQGELIFQDDTPQRSLTLIEENQQARARAQAQGKAKPAERTGMQPTALIVQVGARRICLYYTGRRHAGENLDVLLTQRAPDHDKPLVMSDALRRNNAEEDALIRCHCLAHGRRKFSELDETFPVERAVVGHALKLVFDHEASAQAEQLTAQERLAYHQRTSGPIMQTLKEWLAQQTAQRLGEPNSSVGKAIAYMGEHWATLTRFLHEPGAPIDNNLAARAVQVAMRQRKNSLFYATEHSAYIASILTSVIATCVQAGVNALDYLVAVQEHRQEVRANPRAWLPWNYQAALVPS
jgi:transposase